MAQITRSTKVGGGTVLQANTLARATDVETDILTLTNAHNTHDDGSAKWQVVSAENSSSVPLIANNSTGTQNIFEARDNGTARLTVADAGTVTLTCANGGSNKTLVVNNGTSTGNILELQDNGSAVVTVADGGVATFSGQLVGKGTATNDSPSAGYIGEVMSSAITSNQNLPSTGQYGDLTSLALTAGDWLISAFITFNSATSTSLTDVDLGISTTSGNSSSGLTAGDSLISPSTVGFAGNERIAVTFPPRRFSIASTTTHYLKYRGSYVNGQPVAVGRMTAVRIR